MPTVELDMIIEEIDEDHTGRVTFERKYTDDDIMMVESLCVGHKSHYLTKTTRSLLMIMIMIMMTTMMNLKNKSKDCPS